jgi:thiol-disulfide isomerase/thioredoxin
MMWWLWTLGIAYGGDLSDTWALYSTLRMDEARIAVAELLAEDPDNTEYHRAYATILGGWQLYEHGIEAEAMYRQWHEAEPDRLTSRLGLARILYRNDKNCKEASALLSDVEGSDARERYSIERVRLVLANGCEVFDPDAVKARLQAISKEAEASLAAKSYGLFKGLEEGVFDQAKTDASLEVAKMDPTRLTSVARLVWSKSAKGPALKRARVALLEQAAGQMNSDSYARLAEAHSVFRQAKDPRKEAVEQSMARLYPKAEEEEEHRETPKDLMEVYQASKAPSHALSVERLDAFEPKVATSGPARLYWCQLRYQHLVELEEREADAYAMLKEIAALSPDSVEDQNNWAWTAALRGEDLEAAHAAISLATTQLAKLELVQRDDPVESAADWRDSMGAYLDTRAWIEHKLGDNEAAYQSLCEALRYRTDPELHAHMVAVAKALERPEVAFAHAQASLLAGDCDDDADTATVLEVFAAGFSTHHGWHPGGAKGWVDAHRASGTLEQEEAYSPTDHSLLGQPLPISSAQALEGGEVSLIQLDGPLVIDLWATWCGPCIAGMPHLAEVAQTFADRNVTVVGISVDTKKAPAVRFYKGAPDLGYAYAWLGWSAMETFDVRGIPALFVVDQNGIVREYISGYGGKDDHRLEEALVRILDET